MKILFLDIDGVMNSANGTGPYLADMEVSKLELLKQIITENNIEGIVVSSDRRYSKVYMQQFEDAFDQYEILIVGETRRPKDLEEDLDDNRGKQIQDYLETSNEPIDRIAILDDIDDGISELFPDEFVLINRFFGLNEDTRKRLLEIFND